MMAECRMALRIVILLAGSGVWFFWDGTLEQTSKTRYVTHYTHAGVHYTEEVVKFL